ncbi:hypothetical protein MAR_012975, partial [Mya arenaria]
MYSIVEQCPELISSMGEGVMPSQEEIQRTCTQIPSGPCMTAMTCIASASQTSNMGFDESFRATNNLTFLIPLMGMSC